MNPETLRTLSGDHDLLWILPADLVAGDVILAGGAAVRTVLGFDFATEPGRVRVRVSAPGSMNHTWALPEDRAVLVLRPVLCPECGDTTRHDPELCARWSRTLSSVEPWAGTEAPF